MKKCVFFLLFLSIIISGCIDPYNRIMTSGPPEKNVVIEEK